MRAVFLSALAAGFLATAAQADTCVYKGETIEGVAQTISFSEGETEMRVDAAGDVRTGHTSGVGTGLNIRVAWLSGDEGDPSPYLFVDLKDVAKPGAPDHVLIFDNAAYWPECR